MMMLALDCYVATRGRRALCVCLSVRAEALPVVAWLPAVRSILQHTKHSDTTVLSVSQFWVRRCLPHLVFLPRKPTKSREGVNAPKTMKPSVYFGSTNLFLYYLLNYSKNKLICLFPVRLCEFASLFRKISKMWISIGNVYCYDSYVWRAYNVLHKINNSCGFHWSPVFVTQEEFTSAGQTKSDWREWWGGKSEATMLPYQASSANYIKQVWGYVVLDQLICWYALGAAGTYRRDGALSKHVAIHRPKNLSALCVNLI